MDKPDFVYVTYIATTPETLWVALTKSEITREYWRHDNVSDWREGSAWEHRPSGGEAGEAHIVGKVVESSPPKRLVVTWARPSDADDMEKHSRVTYEIEPLDSAVKLTVSHDQLEGDPKMAQGISKGWPAVLSSLKSYLETGQPLTHFW